MKFHSPFGKEVAPNSTIWLRSVVLNREAYAETVFLRSDEQARPRAEMRLRKQVALLGFQIIPAPADLAM
jgi:hypothetical protein